MPSDFNGLWGLLIRDKIPFRERGIEREMQKMQQEINQTAVSETTTWPSMYPFRDTHYGSTTCCDSSETSKEGTE